MRYPMHAFILLLCALVVACGGPTNQPAVDQPVGTTVAVQAGEGAPAQAATDVAPAAMTSGQPITLSGTGPATTDPVMVPWDNARVIFSHNGDRNFVVTANQNGVEDPLVNYIGEFEGTRALLGTGEVYFVIDADGDWTVRVEPLGQADGAPFSGTGPAVSGLFEAPASGLWTISHDGSRNFVVNLHCASGSDLIQNEIGKVDVSTEVSFGTGPCFWEVEADGDWSLAPE